MGPNEMARRRVPLCSMCSHFWLSRHCPSHLIGLCPAPQKDDLEREPLLRGRPVLLVRVDCHAYWVSNAILSKLHNIPDEVDGGLIVRDKAGNPTGPYRFPSHRPPFCPLSGLSDQACLSIMQRILSTSLRLLRLKLFSGLIRRCAMRCVSD